MADHSFSFACGNGNFMKHMAWLHYLNLVLGTFGNSCNDMPILALFMNCELDDLILNDACQ
jgi:hypothetical protein